MFKDISVLIHSLTPIATLAIGLVTAGSLAAQPNIDKNLPVAIATGTLAMAGTAYQPHK
jgi:hypothetical protein